MTSQVKVSAHCADNKEVVVRVFNVATDQGIEEFTLQNGESREVLIYDDRAVATHERVKKAETTPSSQYEGVEKLESEEVDPEVGVPASILK